MHPQPILPKRNWIVEFENSTGFYIGHQNDQYENVAVIKGKNYFNKTAEEFRHASFCAKHFHARLIMVCLNKK